MARELAYDDQGRLLIDVRGPRVGAAITSVILATAIVAQGRVGIALLAWQWAVFAVSTFFGLKHSVYGNVFRWAKRRFDLGPPPATELEAAPRFAQACGFAVASIALVLLVIGQVTAGWIAAGIVLALSVLLATTGICIGCELYVLLSRLRGASTPA
jgi:hypothetical protein